MYLLSSISIVFSLIGLLFYISNFILNTIPILLAKDHKTDKRTIVSRPKFTVGPTVLLFYHVYMLLIVIKNQ